MRRDDTEFTAYLAARWPALVRTLVLLGHPGDEAHRIAFDALVRIHPDWKRIHREEDVEVAVYREVMDARERHLRRADDPVDPVDPDDPTPAPPRPVPPGLDEQIERLDEVVAALDGLDPDDRRVVVLRQVAELSDDQVADVLDEPVSPGVVLPDADVRLALEAIPVDPLRPEQVGAEHRTRRRRLLRRTTAGAVALVVLVLAGSWLWQRGDSVGDVTAADNPLPMAWFADGQLHLADLRVSVPPVVDLVTVPDGVVLTTEEGEVIMVDDSGSLTTLGRTVPGNGLVVEPDNGWVAWADPGTGEPEMVVHDTRVGDEVARRSLASPGGEAGQPVGGSGPIAIDGERVFYSTRGTDFVWEPVPDAAFALSGHLLDTADGARISHVSGGYLLQAQPFQSGTVIEGTEGRLTPDGRYAFVVQDDELVVYDVDSGEPIERMYSPSDQALSWTYTEDTFWITVQHKLQDKRYQDMLQMPSEGDYRIFECVPGRADACVDRAEVPEDVADAPVLAR